MSNRVFLQGTTSAISCTALENRKMYSTGRKKHFLVLIKAHKSSSVFQKLNPTANIKVKINFWNTSRKIKIENDDAD